MGERWHLGDRTAIYTERSDYVKRCETREAAEHEIAVHNELVSSGEVRRALIHEWTRVERPVRERIHLRWPRLAELLDDLSAAS